MAWPIQKDITVGETTVSTVSDKVEQPDQSAVIETTATVGSVSYTERWTLPRSNQDYSQEQAQTDFDAHLLKVATEAMGRNVSHSVLDGLV